MLNIFELELAAAGKELAVLEAAHLLLKETIAEEVRFLKAVEDANEVVTNLRNSEAAERANLEASPNILNTLRNELQLAYKRQATI